MSPTVLIVEDESKLRELIRSFLEREGITVLSAATGADAMALAARSEPDLVVLDLGLPDIAGLELVTELRRGSDVLVLILTAMSSEEDRIRGLELGADDYVTKPFSPPNSRCASLQCCAGVEVSTKDPTNAPSATGCSKSTTISTKSAFEATRSASRAPSGDC